MKKISEPLKIVLFYAFFSGLWIVFSDLAVEFLFKEKETIVTVSILKGWFFILITSLLLYFLVKTSFKKIKETEEKNALALKGIHFLIKKLNDYVFLLSIDGKIKGASDIAYRTAGIDSSLIRERNIKTIIKKENWPVIDEILAAHAGGKDLSQAKIKMIVSEGKEREIEAKTSLIDFGSEKMILVIARDITDTVDREEFMKKALEEANRSNRELEQFAYIVSHDLREPLRTISNYISLIQKRISSLNNPETDEFMNFVTSAASRMTELINGVLQYSRIATRGDKFSLVDMNKAVEEVITRLAFKIQETGAVIKFKNLHTVNGDNGQIVLLLQNLIENAIKFCKKGAPPIIEIASYKNSQETVFSVKDYGIGIAPEFHEKIFQIFQRLHSVDDYEGTGLGLAVCKKIVERHKGRIWIESEEGKGSIFYFSIPEEK